MGNLQWIYCSTAQACIGIQVVSLNIDARAYLAHAFVSLFACYVRVEGVADMSKGWYWRQCRAQQTIGDLWGFRTNTLAPVRAMMTVVPNARTWQLQNVASSNLIYPHVTCHKPCQSNDCFRLKNASSLAFLHAGHLVGSPVTWTRIKNTNNKRCCCYALLQFTELQRDWRKTQVCK